MQLYISVNARERRLSTNHAYDAPTSGKVKRESERKEIRSLPVHKKVWRDSPPQNSIAIQAQAFVYRWIGIDSFHNIKQ